MIRRMVTVAMFAVGFAFISFIVGSPIQAEEVGKSFTITPPIFELKANPGDKLDEVISLFNSGESDLTIAVTYENLRPMGEKGQVQVVGGDDESLPSLKDWIKASETTFSLKKGETKNIDFSIAVPGNAEPGGHFATILFGTTNSGKDPATGSLVSQKIGTLVLLTVAGQAEENAQVVSFSAAKRIFWQNQDINFTTRIRNDGNVYIRPRGFLVITDIFGRKVSETEIDAKNILPSATREATVSFKPKHLIGPFTASIVLVYGDSNQNLNSTTGFWIIPWLSTLIVITVLIIVILLRCRLWRALKILLGRDKN
jgi:hypothetical protein